MFKSDYFTLQQPPLIIHDEILAACLVMLLSLNPFVLPGLVRRS